MASLHYIGVPRIGPQRELKWATERFWQGRKTLDDLQETARILRRNQWQRQHDSGAAWLSVGDFAWFDHILEQSLWFGVVPQRFRGQLPDEHPRQVFAIARGVSGEKRPDLAASPMRKWFDTNYHYLVPEWDADTRPQLNLTPLLQQVAEAREVSDQIKVQLTGPLTYLRLSQYQDITPEAALERLIPVYQQALQTLADAGVSQVQLDEPALCTDLDMQWRSLAERGYSFLASSPVPLLVATYFGGLEDNLSLTAQLPVQGMHIDLVSAAGQLTQVLDRLGPNKILSLGVINGRNIWRADLDRIYDIIKPVHEQLGERLWLSSSCSLLHVPYSARQESVSEPLVNGALAFMEEKQEELGALCRRLNGAPESTWEPVFVRNRRARTALSDSELRGNPRVSSRLSQLSPDERSRQTPFSRRKVLQQERLNLPLVPTTTIGSFPQTSAIRAARRDFRRGEMSRTDYTATMKEAIRDAINRQLTLGLDVLVHGEPERNDMVEYFGEQLAGFTSSRQGWVQSYGTRCVKPPIIYGDVYRPEAMTVPWITYAQSLTDKPVKGMLTGPTTMIAWSFVREDLAHAVVAEQIGLALRDEIEDLEAAGIGVIQVDEPALREKLPLRHHARRHWLDNATAAFRLATAGVAATTQIHTHMCYSHFEDILDGIRALDADVITIEAARSEMKLVADLARAGYEGDVGPGLYDIHSPSVPEAEQLVRRLERVLDNLPANRVWANPDCGLKTRQWPETEAALKAMVTAARQVRRSLETGAGRQPETAG